MYKARLKDYYDTNIVKQLQEVRGYTSRMAVPKIEKVIVSMTSKDLVANPKSIDDFVEQLFAITGQKPVVTKAKKSIASFKLREGMPIGVKVTLRNNMMYEFLDCLINIVLPNTKDFRGLSAKQFDKNGNFSLSVKEQIVFPSINYDDIDKIRGVNVVVVTSAKSNDEAKDLLKLFNFPFKN